MVSTILAGCSPLLAPPRRYVPMQLKSRWLPRPHEPFEPPLPFWHSQPREPFWPVRLPVLSWPPLLPAARLSLFGLSDLLFPSCFFSLLGLLGCKSLLFLSDPFSSHGQSLPVPLSWPPPPPWLFGLPGASEPRETSGLPGPTAPSRSIPGSCRVRIPPAFRLALPVTAT